MGAQEEVKVGAIEAVSGTLPEWCVGWELSQKAAIQEAFIPCSCLWWHSYLDTGHCFSFYEAPDVFVHVEVLFNKQQLSAKWQGEMSLNKNQAIYICAHAHTRHLCIHIYNTHKYVGSDWTKSATCGWVTELKQKPSMNLFLNLELNWSLSNNNNDNKNCNRLTFKMVEK